MTTDFDWNDIPLILSLARSGSMSATGRALGLNTSTVSRRLAAAEKALALRLFIRDNTRYQLTDAGRVFVEYGEAVYGNVHDMLTASTRQAQAIAGTVRVTAIDFLLDYWLMAHLPALQAQHPQLQLQLTANNGNLSFTRREVDLALRLSKPDADAALVMRKLGQFSYAVYGHARHAGLARADWGRHGWIGYDDTLAHLPEMAWIAGLSPRPPWSLRVNSLSTMVRACREGVGLALLPCLIGQQEGLTRLAPQQELHRELWLLSHRDAGSIARFKLVAEWLTGLYADSVARLCG
ncbi:LysR family transcriptional regulator [Rugamonas sp.]|uniref:LysR family transcriptional regulator n=1 Tax=Rugamonas sp. TaxID=1926287 RepID=UPI0025E53834|nr:LysR family transcriptional regulator [Rugamonas sp.]